MNPDHCLLERDGHVLVVTLNRPEAKNALSSGMLAGMYRAWRMLDEDPELRVAILTGRGDVFCAGADLKAMGGGGERDDEFQKLMAEVPDLHWQALLRHNRPLKPIIAAVEGFAVAGGTEILQGTDIRVAAETAIFGVTEAQARALPARRQQRAAAPTDPVHAGGRDPAHRATRHGPGGARLRPDRPRRSHRPGARRGAEDRRGDLRQRPALDPRADADAARDRRELLAKPTRS